jgi:hypothetical protein
MQRERARADIFRAFITAERKAAMSADILKRKIRNFPVANLTERIATAS